MTTPALRLLPLTLAALAACTSPEPAGSGQPATAQDATDPSAEVLALVCASPCAGPMARVRVFRDAEKKVGRLRFEGDLGTCSHPPHIYFDAAGKETLTVPERPVTGPEDAAALAKQSAAQSEGLTLAETLRCAQSPGG